MAHPVPTAHTSFAGPVCSKAHALTILERVCRSQDADTPCAPNGPFPSSWQPALSCPALSGKQASGLINLFPGGGHQVRLHPEQVDCHGALPEPALLRHCCRAQRVNLTFSQGAYSIFMPTLAVTR